MRGVVAAALQEGPLARVAPWVDRSLPETDRYRLDPWAHVEDGHVIVPDLVTMEAKIWTPYQHQIDATEAWLDLGHLRETAKTGVPVLRFRNVHEEKSRQMGMTWGIAWPLLWAVMYHRVSLLAIHQHLAELDDGGAAATIKSLFGRMLYMAKGELEVGKTVWPDHLRPLRRLQWKSRPSIIQNVITNGFLTAEGATPDPARGARFHGILLDEAARIPWSEAVHASVSRACPSGMFYNSTPYGSDNTYGRLAKQRPRNFLFLRHHWSIHPLYSEGLHVAGDDPDCELCDGNRRGDAWDAEQPTCHRYPGKLTSPWFDRAVLDLTDEQVAQELEINYSGALTGRVYPEFNDEIHVLPHIPYDPRLPIETAWDYGVRATTVAILQETATEIRQIGEVELGADITGTGTPAIPDTVVPELLDVLADLGVPLAELEPQFTRDWLGVGDIAGDAATPTTGEPLTAAYAKLGFTIQAKKRAVDETIRTTKRVLLGRPKRYVISGLTCPRTIEHWRENRWPTGRDGNITPNAREPKNDRHNHMLRGLAYYFTWKYPAPSIDEALTMATSGNAGAGDLEGLMADATDSLEPLSYGMRLHHRNIRHGCQFFLNGDRGRARVSGLRGAEEVTGFTALP